MRAWTIYSNGIGGWCAWNSLTRTRKTLVQFGTFADAVAVYEKKFGQYYDTDQKERITDE